jgi:hypothetical protein
MGDLGRSNLMSADNEYDREDAVNPDAMETALHQMGQRARQEAFAAGLSVLVVRSGRMVKLIPDGREEDLGPLTEKQVTVPQ